jgi:hypothetical protein
MGVRVFIQFEEGEDFNTEFTEEPQRARRFWRQDAMAEVLQPSPVKTTGVQTPDLIGWLQNDNFRGLARGRDV